MTFRNFLKDKVIGMVLMLASLATIETFLLFGSLMGFLRIYIPVAVGLAYGLALGLEYWQKHRYYQQVYQILEELEDKYLLPEIISCPSFWEGKVMKEVLEETNRAMLEQVNNYRYEQKDYKDYIEMWVHEMKLPLATSKMLVENHKNEVAKSLEEEFDKMENHMEQALYYARSNTANQDYLIQKHKLQEMVNECMKKNRASLIGAKIAIHTKNLDIVVPTDSKWFMFMLNQVLQNAVKYRNPNRNSEITVEAREEKEHILLLVRDNGMGIPENEVQRVFEKGFTGTNGRLFNRTSTGIGLYLCKKLCDKLGMGITISSEPGEGTEVAFWFPNNSYVTIAENLTKS